MISFAISLLTTAFIMYAFVMAAIAIVCLAELILGIGFIRSVVHYTHIRNTVGSGMICPNCHSYNVRLNRERTGNLGFGLYGGGLAFGDHMYTSQRMAKCADCGFDYPFYTDGEVEYDKRRARRGIFWWGLFLALCTMLLVCMI